MNTGKPWVKVWTVMLHDDKLAELDRGTRLRFVELLLLAGECDARGCLINGAKPLTISRIAFRLHDTVAAVENDVADLIRLGFIAQTDLGLIIKNWEKWQGGSTQHEKREAWRARQKAHRDVTRDARVTSRNVTPPEGEGEGEGEREEEVQPPHPPASTPPPTLPPGKAPIPMDDQISDAMRSMGAPPRKRQVRNARRLTADEEPRLNDPRVAAWVETFGSIRPPTLREVDLICERVNTADLAMWRTTVAEWAAGESANGRPWSLDNIEGMIERHQRKLVAAQNSDAKARPKPATTEDKIAKLRAKLEGPSQ